MKKGYLILEDGHIFEGTRFGAAGTALGELVFTTGMCGYIETLTDPSYYGQIVVQTFPLIGNYGFIPADAESGRSFVNGYIVREWCDTPSNFRAEGTIGDYLKKNNIVGLYGVDTRQITKLIRDSGVMNAYISDTPDIDIDKLKRYKVENAVKAVSSLETRTFTPEGASNYKVVLLDYGAKHNITRELVKRGCTVVTLPYSATAEQIAALSPDGIMLSNGPGDPAENTEFIAELKKLFGRYPIFGICLGHQLLALANGGKTVKLKYGHRGVNQPVKELATGRVYITSQNHGYAVVSDSLASSGGTISFINANDGTCEGVNYPGKRAFSVQFHPEHASGPKDIEFLFDRFLALMGGSLNAVK